MTFLSNKGTTETISFVYSNTDIGGAWVISSDTYKSLIPVAKKPRDRAGSKFPGEEKPQKEVRFAIRWDGTQWVEK